MDREVTTRKERKKSSPANCQHKTTPQKGGREIWTETKERGFQQNYQDHQNNTQPLATPGTHARTDEVRPNQVNVTRNEENVHNANSASSSTSS